MTSPSESEKTIYATNLSFKNDNEIIKFREELISMRFVDEILKFLHEHNISQKAFAKAIGVTPSYVSQIFNSNKTVNLNFLARVEKFYEARFTFLLREKTTIKWKSLDTMKFKACRSQVDADIKKLKGYALSFEEYNYQREAA